ncbi:MAG: hypothetical protein OFPI_18260 [Osedax symbiont Rs2]|nr:MAG: hypothetical protein OFPI_18260 [Osedax symbiont Rs2]
MQCIAEELIKAELNQYIEKMLNKQLRAKSRDKTKSHRAVVQVHK